MSHGARHSFRDSSSCYLPGHTRPVPETFVFGTLSNRTRPSLGEQASSGADLNYQNPTQTPARLDCSVYRQYPL